MRRCTLPGKRAYPLVFILVCYLEQGVIGRGLRQRWDCGQVQHIWWREVHHIHLLSTAVGCKGMRESASDSWVRAGDPLASHSSSRGGSGRSSNVASRAPVPKITTTNGFSSVPTPVPNVVVIEINVLALCFRHLDLCFEGGLYGVSQLRWKCLGLWRHWVGDAPRPWSRLFPNLCRKETYELCFMVHLRAWDQYSGPSW